MHLPAAVVGLLEVRADIPNSQSFGSGPANSSCRTPFLRGLAAFLVTIAFLSIALRFAVRLAIGLL
jgi:hypothetical protein